MTRHSAFPYEAPSPDEYLDRPPRSAPGQATPVPATDLTADEHATAARDCRRVETEYRSRAAELRAKGDGHRVWALSAESTADRYARMATAHEAQSRRNQ